jgi:hypothetical protein
VLSSGNVSSGVGVYWMFYSGGDFEAVPAPEGLPGLVPGQAYEGARMRAGLAMSQVCAGADCLLPRCCRCLCCCCRSHHCRGNCGNLGRSQIARSRLAAAAGVVVVWSQAHRPGTTGTARLPLQDGRHWARIEGEHHTGAMLDVGAAGEWDELFIGCPQVGRPGVCAMPGEGGRGGRAAAGVCWALPRR